MSCYWTLVRSVFFLFQLTKVEDVGAILHHKSTIGSKGTRVVNCSTQRIPSHLCVSATDPQVENFDEWSDERKAGLFQFLLRDLEIEGVPLLGCDGVSASKTLQGATWTVAGQLNENDDGQKVCLVLEDVLENDLKAFAEMFSRIKERRSLTRSLPDLRRFSLSLVGEGKVGNALILATQNRTKSESAEYDLMMRSVTERNEPQWKIAIESFIQRTFPVLEKKPIEYEFIRSFDVCDILSGYWNSICKLEASGVSGANAIVLSFPPTSGEQTLDGFAAVSELINVMNSSYKSQYQYDLFFFHPCYDSDKIQSQDEDSNGHLPRITSLREKILEESDNEAAKMLTDEQLKLQNYQRRSPLQGVLITKALYSEENKIADFNYQNILRLVEEGEENLKGIVMKESELLSGNQ
mmetsp:Transcript_15083/g.34979  ORF Transcript_15083/g.34979 Transcript_15083/m.34979 type:complete len:409 (-) Transcript_15083:834-2060(-)